MESTGLPSEMGKGMKKVRLHGRGGLFDFALGLAEAYSSPFQQ